MLISKYGDSDLEAVLSSWENASRLAHPFLTGEYFEQERGMIPKEHLPSADTWIAEVGNEVVGFIALIGTEIGAIFVQPGLQGKGVVKALMDKAKALHAVLEVEVFAKNPIGRAIYSKSGFVPVARKYHQETGQKILRLRFNPSKRLQADAAASPRS